MVRELRNVGASVRVRLLERARAERSDFQILLTRYALERLLYRLSISAERERFVLKGAMLFVTCKRRCARRCSSATLHPEDNLFTIWLGAKLAAMGYEDWADVLGFKGGDDRPRKLEHALRHRTCKMLLVANPHAADTQGVRNKIQIASDVARTIGVMVEQGRPPESVFDFVQGITAMAGAERHQDARLDVELKAKRLMDQVAA